MQPVSLGPLADKIDLIKLSRKFRELREAEEYAKRVMGPNYSAEECTRITQALTKEYPTHSFVIDRTEAGSETAPLGSVGRSLNIGLHVSQPSTEIEEIFSRLVPYLQGTIIGRIVEAD
jgi:hypothetical protein